MTRRPTTPDDPTAAAAPAAAAPWRVALLGPVRAAHPALGAAAFRTQRAKSILALLVDAGGAPLGRLQIATALWPESASGPANLACELFHLRKRFDAPGAPFFVAAGGALAVDPARCDADVAAFRADLAAADAATGPARLAALERAVALYGGPFAADVYDDWTDAPRRALADACLGALDALAEAYLAAGDPDRAVAHARRALGLDALDRRAAVALLGALAAAGHRGRARDAADAIAADHAAADVAPDAELARAIAAARAGPSPVLPPTGGAAPSDEPSAVVPVLPLPAVPAAPAAPPLPSGTLTFVIADEAPAERRVARSPVRGEPWLPKSERERVLAAPADPAEAARERDAGRALAWHLFEGRVREAAGRCVAPRIAVFAGALDAVEAAAATLEALAAQDPLRRDRATMPQLRLALVTAEAAPAAEAAGFPYDPAIAARLERLVAAAAGWQVLCEDATALLVAAEQQLNIGRRVERLGLVRLDPAAAPQAVHGLRYGGSEGFRYPPPAGLVPAAGAAALASSTSFVGRGDDLARIGAWITDPTRRLITLKGLGGIGKTRLAMELAAAHRDRLAVWSASLVDLRDGALIGAEVVKAMGESVPAGMTAEDVIVAALSRRPSLLVLDNLEHLLDPAVAFIDRLLSSDALPDLTVVATSRDRLKHSAEHVYDVAPLPVPDARPRPVPVLPPHPSPSTAAVADDPVRGNDSVRLFADRAAAKRAAFGDAFAADDAAAADVARLVTLLEGIPLAIELAAAKIAALSPAQMADQIERHLGGGRYGLLKGADRDIPERHKSLQAAMDWSWALLTPAQQRFLASLSVFRGGMTLEAAAYVTEDPEALDHLLALVDASLLQRLDVAGEREPRFGMLETVREYGEGWLADQDHNDIEGRRTVDVSTLRRRADCFFVQLIAEAEPEMTGATLRPWLLRLDAELPNIRELLADRHDEQANLRLNAARRLYRFWLHGGASKEGIVYLQSSLAMQAPLTDRVAGALSEQGGSPVTGDLPSVRAVPGDHRNATLERAHAEMVLGVLLWQSGDAATGVVHLRESARQYKSADDPDKTIIALHNLASAQYEIGEIRRAKRAFWREILLRRRRYTPRIANSLYNAALVAWRQCDYRTAVSLLNETIELASELDDARVRIAAHQLLALVCADTGEIVRAREHLSSAEAQLAGYDDAYHRAHYLLSAARVALTAGEIECARARAVEAESLAAFSGIDHVEAEACAFLGEVAFVAGDVDLASKRIRAGIDQLVRLGVNGIVPRLQALAAASELSAGVSHGGLDDLIDALSQTVSNWIVRDAREIVDLLLQLDCGLALTEASSTSSKTGAMNTVLALNHLRLSSTAVTHMDAPKLSGPVPHLDAHQRDRLQRLLLEIRHQTRILNSDRYWNVLRKFSIIDAHTPQKF